MGRIFKYEIRRRLNTILILSGTMAVLAIGSMVLLGIFKTPLGTMGTTGNLWLGLTFFALAFIPLVMFFTCSNGHIDELLYKDTNYLMLTIPIRSEAILGGRILAGFVEYLIYALIACIFFIIIGAQQAVFYGTAGQNLISVLGDIFYQIFAQNFLPFLYGVLLLVSSFLLVGTAFMFVKALTRSFIRKKMAAQIIAVILFILIFERIIALGTYLSTRWDLVQYIDLRLMSSQYDAFVNIQPMPVHLVTIIMTMLISAGFFAATSWLFNKKVEL
ncbi:hypothetical protein E4N80_11105 [Treponema denticola]|uniref:hypothetical protein n=1 Tax=Treponema denticola TaxID=158 RepID=UPI0020A2BFD3|nr:hypothetical protein [Treponema denticola]UTD05988.1 hypothetical protein E4N80_11105 [Treponema denticola]UYT07714.1 hypothetical protein OE909_12200 [Treponema denticola]